MDEKTVWEPFSFSTDPLLGPVLCRLEMRCAFSLSDGDTDAFTNTICTVCLTQAGTT